MMKNFHDLVISEGRFVGKFDEMYQNFDDPWDQSQECAVTREKKICLSFIQEIKPSKVCELGSGLGFFANKIHLTGAVEETFGLEISSNAIKRSRSLFPHIKFFQSSFDNFDILNDLKPDVIVMSEISWYVLPQLKNFIDKAKSFFPGRYLIHILTTYKGDIQKYGRDYFTNHDEILRFFNLNYIEFGTISSSDSNISKNYFIAGL